MCILYGQVFYRLAMLYLMNVQGMMLVDIIDLQGEFWQIDVEITVHVISQNKANISERFSFLA